MLQKTKLPELDGRSTAAQFIEEHDYLLREVKTLTDHNASLLAQNSGLLSENTMLREELGRTDKDRVRIQGFAAGLATRLAVIQETISVALQEAAAHKIQPEEKNQIGTIALVNAPQDEPRAAAEVRDIISRLPPNSFMR